MKQWSNEIIKQLNKDRLPILIFILLSLSILLPFLKSGYIFTMDMVFPPKIQFPEISYCFLFQFCVWLLNLFIPSQIIQKIIIFAILFFSGYSMYKLIPTRSEWPKYFAGIFYLFNPFVYTRFMYGHFLLLLAYALFPFFVKALFDFFKNPEKQKTIKLIIWTFVLIQISIHFIYIIILFFLVSIIFYLIKLWKHDKYKRNLLYWISIIIIATLLLNSFWLIPEFTQKTKYITSVNDFDEKNLLTFQTTKDKKYGLLLNTAGLYGFWTENQNRYVSQKEMVPNWYILIWILISLSLWGIITKLKIKNAKYQINAKQQNPNAKKIFQFPISNFQFPNIKYLISKNPDIIIIFITSIIAFFLAMGISFEPLKEFNLALYNHLPFYKGLREPQKWSAILCLGFAYLGALGINDIIKRLNKIKILQSLAIGFFIALPFIYSPGLFWGFRGQLFSTDYPKDWYEVNDLLNQDQDNFKVLFLPWHQYMSFKFIKNKVIANPASRFFDKKTIKGDNIEVNEIYSSSSHPESKLIQRLINKKNKKNFTKDISSLNIKYIILAKEFDWQFYDFLDQQKDLRTIYDQENLRVYKITFNN